MPTTANNAHITRPATSLVDQVVEAEGLVYRAIPQPDRPPASTRKARRLVPWLPGQTKQRLVDKALGSVHDRLVVAARLLRHRSDSAGTGGLTDCVQQVRQLTGRQGSDTGATPASVGAELEEAAVWQLDHDLECALVELGDIEHLRACLEDELRRDSSLDEPRRRLSRDQLIEFEQLRNQLFDHDAQAKARARSIEVLVDRYNKRAHDGRHREAREAMRRRLLALAAAALTIVVVVFAWFVIVAVGVRWVDIALVASSAMLGSLLSGLRRLRDELQRIGELTAFWSAFLAQVAAGAGLGILALVLFKAGILPVIGQQATVNATGGQAATSSQPAMIATYAFAAGFSEPFVIGAIQRIVGARS
jgi:hypothetical protein